MVVLSTFCKKRGITNDKISKGEESFFENS